MSFSKVAPLLTVDVARLLDAARRDQVGELECSLDLQRSITRVEIAADEWRWRGATFPYIARCKERTVYYWREGAFVPISRYSSSLIKLVPTPWGPPTFEIDGIKMLPSAKISPYADAACKVDLVQPAGKVILDTCGGLGYFAAWCLERRAARILSFEKNPDVLWIRTLNPWSPTDCDPLKMHLADIVSAITQLPTASVDAALHDPPRFGTAGELYSQSFYEQLSRVIRRGGKLFHYTGSPNKLTSGRDVQNEVAVRLRRSGFSVKTAGDGLLAART